VRREHAPCRYPFVIADQSLPIFEGPPPPLAVRSVEVEALHGKFNYSIDFFAPVQGLGARQADRLLALNEDRLTLLYGRNGTGKTSVLRLLFHAVAAAERRGHRTELARTRFHRFAVTLTDGSLVSYVRREGSLSGSFLASVARTGRETVRWEVQPNEEGAVRSPENQLVLLDDADERGEGAVYRTVNEEKEFLAALGSLNLNPIFLADSRGIVGDSIARENPRQEDLLRTRDWRHAEELRRSLDIEDAIDLVRRYLTGLAFEGAQAGSSKVDSVYLNVAKAISEHAEGSASGDELIRSLIERVNQVGARVKVLHEYGLLPDLQYDRLVGQLKEAPEQRGDLLQQVLSPYLEGLERRVDALEPGLAAVSTFIDALNSFLEGKTAEFHLGPEGFIIRDNDSGAQLAPAELSSGEKQVVLLFSDVVALQNETRVFIIDEPELSLNPEWQRELMPRLLAVTEQSRMQIIVATHSIEILAQYRERIHRLDNV